MSSSLRPLPPPPLRIYSREALRQSTIREVDDAEAIPRPGRRQLAYSSFDAFAKPASPTSPYSPGSPPHSPTLTTPLLPPSLPPKPASVPPITWRHTGWDLLPALIGWSSLVVSELFWWSQSVQLCEAPRDVVDDTTGAKQLVIFQVTSDHHLSSLCPIGDLDQRGRFMMAKWLYGFTYSINLGDNNSFGGGSDGQYNISKIPFLFGAQNTRQKYLTTARDMRSFVEGMVLLGNHDTADEPTDITLEWFNGGNVLVTAPGNVTFYVLNSQHPYAPAGTVVDILVSHVPVGLNNDSLLARYPDLGRNISAKLVLSGHTHVAGYNLLVNISDRFNVSDVRNHFTEFNFPSYSNSRAYSTALQDGCGGVTRRIVHGDEETIAPCTLLTGHGYLRVFDNGAMSIALCQYGAERAFLFAFYAAAAVSISAWAYARGSRLRPNLIANAALVLALWTGLYLPWNTPLRLS